MQKYVRTVGSLLKLLKKVPKKYNKLSIPEALETAKPRVKALEVGACGGTQD